MSRPRMRVWMNSVTPPRPRALRGASRARPADAHSLVLLRPPSRNDLVRRRRLVGQHYLGDSALPLPDEELALGAPLIIPAERSQDGVDLVLAQPVGQLDLTILLDRAARLHGGRENLRGGVGVRRVLRHLRPTEHLLILRHEFRVARRLRLLAVADGVEDALGGSLADCLAVLVAERRRRGLVEPVRRVVRLA